MKLISMTYFVLNQKQSESFNEKTFINESLISLEKIRNYANFLRQPLKLEMLIPCDEEGDILEKPTNYEQRLPNMMIEYNDEVYRYKQAKEKVLFEGFEITDETELLISKYGFSLYFNQIEDFNIEHLLTWSNEIQLTENAIKQIGL